MFDTGSSFRLLWLFWNIFYCILVLLCVLLTIQYISHRDQFCVFPVVKTIQRGYNPAIVYSKINLICLEKYSLVLQSKEMCVQS